jgi:hypothetical protein
MGGLVQAVHVVQEVMVVEQVGIGRRATRIVRLSSRRLGAGVVGDQTRRVRLSCHPSFNKGVDFLRGLHKIRVN